jgi:hypothetical protein
VKNRHDAWDAKRSVGVSSNWKDSLISFLLADDVIGSIGGFEPSCPGSNPGQPTSGLQVLAAA